MAINTRVSCPHGVWTQLTNADSTTDVSVMLAGDPAVPVSLQATVGATPPTDAVGPFELLRRGDGWSEGTIVSKFPGVAGANRLWAKPAGLDGMAAIVSISSA